MLRLPLLGAALALAAALVASLPTPAHAHGRFPQVGQIAFHPSDPDFIIARATFGLLLTKDGGDTWEWICPEVVSMRLTEDPTVSVTPQSGIVVTLFDGLTLGADEGCNWSFPSEDLTDRVVIDHAVDPAVPARTLAVTSDGAVDNLVFASDDSGFTWTPTGPAIAPILFESIDIAPSDSSVVYLTGAYPPTMDTPRRPFVYRSGDGGTSWTPYEYGGLLDGDRNIFLLGVDPTNPNRLMIRVMSENDDRIEVSEDGGETFAELLSIPRIDGFAWSEDGSTIWTGGLEGTGLFRSTNGGVSFDELPDEIEVGCLASRGDELWICSNNFADGFAIGRSTDDGDSFEPVLVFADIEGVATCPGGSDTTLQCGPVLADLVFDLGLPIDAGVPMYDAEVPPWLDGGTMPTGDGATGMDAGMMMGGGDGGCCSVAAGSRSDGVPAAGFAALIALTLVRRRYRR